MLTISCTLWKLINITETKPGILIIVLLLKLPEDCLVEKLQWVFQNLMFLLCQYEEEYHLGTKFLYVTVNSRSLNLYRALTEFFFHMRSYIETNTSKKFVRVQHF